VKIGNGPAAVTGDPSFLMPRLSQTKGGRRRQAGKSEDLPGHARPQNPTDHGAAL